MQSGALALCGGAGLRAKSMARSSKVGRRGELNRSSGGKKDVWRRWDEKKNKKSRLRLLLKNKPHKKRFLSHTYYARNVL